MPSVFISYSHDPDDPSHAENVARLAASLIQDGLTVFIDANRGTDGESLTWPIWMERSLRVADHVVMICTALYLAKVQQDTEADQGRGVCWEANLIYNEIYCTKFSTTKFIPVVLCEEDTKYIPAPLRGWPHYVVESKPGYDALYARLLGQHRMQFPKQGPQLKSLQSRVVSPMFGPADTTTASWKKVGTFSRMLRGSEEWRSWRLAFKWLNRTNLQDGILGQFQSPDGALRLVVVIEDSPADNRHECLEVLIEIVLKIALKQHVRSDNGGEVLEKIYRAAEVTSGKYQEHEAGAGFGGILVNHCEARYEEADATFATGLHDVMVKAGAHLHRAHLLFVVMLYGRRLSGSRRSDAPGMEAIEKIFRERFESGIKLLSHSLGPVGLEEAWHWIRDERLGRYARIVRPGRDIGHILTRLKVEGSDICRRLEGKLRWWERLGRWTDRTLRKEHTARLNVCRLAEALQEAAAEQGIFD